MNEVSEKTEVTTLAGAARGFAAMMRSGAYVPADAEMVAAKFDELANEIDRVRPPNEFAKARDRVVAAARSFSNCAAEFEGDMAACGEHLDALWIAVDRLKVVESSDCATP